MKAFQDSADLLVATEEASDFTVLTSGPIARADAITRPLPGATTARLHGFDRQDRPLVAGMRESPTEIVTARTTVPLSQAQVGAAVLVICEGGDPRLPIIVGVIHDTSPAPRTPDESTRQVSARVDDERVVLSAEREIVLQCGKASITLTRAGKVIIQGTYVLSRSSGYNRIKGAAVDIN